MRALECKEWCVWKRAKVRKKCGNNSIGGLQTTRYICLRWVIVATNVLNDGETGSCSNSPKMKTWRERVCLRIEYDEATVNDG